MLNPNLKKLQIMMRCSPLVVFVLLLSANWVFSDLIQEMFVPCMSTYFGAYTRNMEIMHTPNSSLYSYILQSSMQNPRWVNSTASKPLLVMTPFHESEIQAAIICSRRYDLQIRIRSGGHDYEGLSYLCATPFILIDLVNLRSITVNIEDETAWVQSGATLGELYYAIAKRSGIHGFPAGLCSTVGIGGHLTGGGFGTMVRKYGLAADNILDAYLIDVNGRVMNRETMGEELFWAIRGGGGASFGIILSWKIKLVPVPKTVTAFTVSRTLEEGATKLVHRWQYIAHKMHEDLFIRIIIQNVCTSNKRTVQASFDSLFLGGIDRLIPLMSAIFPELGLKPKDCNEMSWVESALYFAEFKKGQPLEVLLGRTLLSKSNFKAKSDFVQEPIPEYGLEGIWERFLEEDLPMMIMDPFGGRMDQISESDVPFPHREGNLYNIQYLVRWEDNRIEESNRHKNWIRMLYRYMKPFVSKSPRAAYFNFRDLDLGINNHTKTSYSEGRVWGLKYFKGNFRRLAQVKSNVDPDNFFRSAQSIPPLPAPRKLQNQ